MNILDILKRDHQNILALFDELEASGKASSAREDRFKGLKELLNRHMTAEERVFYPPLENDLPLIMAKSVEAHNLTRVGLNEIDGTSTDSDHWLPRLLVLRDALMAHMTEEESLVFDVARRVLGPDGLQEMGPRFEEAKAGGDVSGFSSIAASTAAVARGAGEEIVDRIRRSL